MHREADRTRLFQACEVLFGPEIDISVDFLRYLRMTGLKAVYRKRALDTHPDRAAALAVSPAVLEERFKEVHAAYRDLHAYLVAPFLFRLGGPGRPGGGTRTPDRGPSGRDREPSRDPHFSWESDRPSRIIVPQRPLLFGQYLYYTGTVSYRDLIAAILWQKVQRPLLGRIGVRWRWLREEDVLEILRQRRRGERFGEAALRGGYLTPERLRTMLGRQRLLQPRIGRYFVEQELLPLDRIEDLASQSRRHNRQFRHRSF